MYTGPTRSVANDFEKCNFPMPPNYNPADWLLDVAQQNDISTLEKAGFFPPAPDSSKDTEVVSEDDKLDAPSSKDHVSTWTEFVMLVDREKRSLIRSPAPMIINIVMTAFLSIISGVIFFKVGTEDRSDVLVRKFMRPILRCALDAN